MKRIEKLSRFRLNPLLLLGGVNLVYLYDDEKKVNSFSSYLDNHITNFGIYLNGQLVENISNVKLEISRSKYTIAKLDGIHFRFPKDEFIRSIIEGLCRDEYLYTPLHEVIRNTKLSIKNNGFTNEIHIDLPKEKELDYD